MRVLIVEDSAPLRESLRLGLSREGFAVDAVGDGELGLERARNNPYDLLVLDLMLPKLNGLSLLAQLREKSNRPHVLILSARDQAKDCVLGLNTGADDYLVKPFVFEELLARLHALVRRRYAEKSPLVTIGELRIDMIGHTATYRGEQLDLTAREFSLLEYLAFRRGQFVSREEIEDHIYGVEKLPSSNAVNSAICILRAKLGSDGKKMIRTKRGQGYTLDAGAQS